MRTISKDNKRRKRRRINIINVKNAKKSKKVNGKETAQDLMISSAEKDILLPNREAAIRNDRRFYDV